MSTPHASLVPPNNHHMTLAHLCAETPSCDHPNPSSDAILFTVFMMRCASDIAKSLDSPGSRGEGVVGPCCVTLPRRPAPAASTLPVPLPADPRLRAPEASVSAPEATPSN